MSLDALDNIVKKMEDAFEKEVRTAVASVLNDAIPRDGDLYLRRDGGIEFCLYFDEDIDGSRFTWSTTLLDLVLEDTVPGGSGREAMAKMLEDTARAVRAAKDEDAA